MMNSAPSPVLQLRLPLWRSRMMLAFVFAGFMTLVGRAVFLQAWDTDFLQQKGKSRTVRDIEIPAYRGKITDRNGEILASSTPVRSIWAIPDDVKASRDQLRDLARALDLPVDELDKKLGDTDREFVYLKRQLPPEEAEKVAELNLPGVFQQREFRRYYPAGEVAAHVLGFTGMDENGQEGIELAYQQSLAGKNGSRRVVKDRRGNIVEDVAGVQAPREGKDLALSIDSKIQYLAYSQLKQAVELHKAKAGGIVILDVKTGEVLALANLPTFNPNNRNNLTGQQLRNRVLTDSFEPGSVMKPFTISLALDEGKITADSTFQTAPGRYKIGTATISDSHAMGILNVSQIIEKSSNIGTAQIALKLQREDMWNMFNRSGFGTAPQVQFPGAVGGRVRPAKSWRPIEQATMGYGYGLSVSLLQLARGYTIFARDGDIIPVTFQKAEGPAVGTQIIAPQVAHMMRGMLELAAGPHGTAPRAQVMGYRVAGKTGTAHKQEGNGYSHDKYRASFVGFAPVSNPRLVVAVMIDEPSDGRYYGGDVSGPVFSSVMGAALRALGVAPDAPMKPIVLPSAAEQVRENT
ncbi:MAG: penicillin-binding protein 2 [Betaproteobacteria bacterium]|nr:penicillin-binding protein 2 [Betaproteobacteria bacterium]